MDTLERKYRKKPVVIEAVPVSNAILAAESNRGALPGWLATAEADGVVRFGDDFIEIQTSEGTMVGELSDMLIRGVAGELYPCKPDIFEATYDPVWGAATRATPSVVERIAELEAAIRTAQQQHVGDGRELSLSLTALEDCQMRFTRGLAKAKGVFAPVDLERVAARAERARFEAAAGEAS
jgi:hypothetical protein